MEERKDKEWGKWMGKIVMSEERGEIEGGKGKGERGKC